MPDTVALLIAVVLFLTGLRLSAFFSGSETGFYQVSYARLSIDAHGGDKVAQRLLWFVQNPSHFVAMTLVGNNVANYLVTVAIGLATHLLSTMDSVAVEIIGTLAVSPIIFIFGELLPKNLFHMAPLGLMRKQVSWLLIFYWLFRPISFPLVWLARLFEQFSSSDSQPLRFTLGRQQLVRFLHEGHEEGLVTEVQRRLVTGMFLSAGQTVEKSMTPAARVLGLPDTASREEVVDFGRRYGLTRVAIRRASEPSGWYGSVRVFDAVVSHKPLGTIIHRLPQIDYRARKLEAFQTLSGAGERLGAVMREGTVIGIVSEQGLVEQLFRATDAQGGQNPIFERDEV